MNTTKSLTNSIFISYAHEDDEFRANILKPLRALEDKYQVKLWDDTCIKVGNEWHNKIQASLRDARVAILLISQDFSASDYIRRYELPVLQERYNNKELELICIIIGKVDLNPLGLNLFQTLPSPDQPIKYLSKKARENVYYDISIVIREVLEGLNEESSNYNHNNGIQAPLSVLSIDQPKLWTSIVPALMGKDEIEKQLNLLINHTKSTGNLIFSRSLYYIKITYYKELNDSSVIVEVVSNANLPLESQHSKVQISLLNNFGFNQPSEQDNLMLVTSIKCNDAPEKLSTICWYILDEILSVQPNSDLVVEGQCK